MNQYVNGEYLQITGDWHEADSEWKAGEVMKLIKTYYLKPGIVYDIGCGSGGVLNELHKHLINAQLIGYDISPQAIELAKKKEKDRLTFYQADITKIELPKANLMLCLDVIEHLENPVEFLNKIKPLADLFIFHIPLEELYIDTEYKDYMFETYGHLWSYNVKRVFKMLGYQFYIVDAFYTDDYDIPNMGSQPEQRRAAKEQDIGLAASLYSHFNLMVLAE